MHFETWEQAKAHADRLNTRRGHPEARPVLEGHGWTVVARWNWRPRKDED